MARQHPIKRYLLATGTTQAELARAAGLSTSYVCELLAGRKVCGAAAAMRFSEASGGAITVDELVRIGRRRRRR
jgi:transcriptional regulator with XRE-family HTH domain